MGPDSSPGKIALPQAGVNAAQILVLSDDDALITTIRSLLHMSRHPLCEVNACNASQFVPEQALTSDCIFIDKVFAGRPPEWALDGIRQIVSVLSAHPPRIVLLCDPNTLGGDLKHMALLARAGVDEFLLRTQMSCQSLLEAAGLIQSHSAGLIPDTSFRPHIASTGITNTSDTATITELPESSGNRKTDTTPDLTAFLEGKIDPFVSQFSPDGGSDPEQDWLDHSIRINLDRQLISIKGVAESPLFDVNTDLRLEEWLVLLTPHSREEIENMIDRAKNYQAIPKTIICHFNQNNTVTLLGHLENIQAQNNGQGRVDSINARLILPNENNRADKEIEDQPSLPTFSDTALKPDNESANVLRSLPTTCLVLAESGEIKRVLNNPLGIAGYLPDFEAGQQLNTLLDDKQLEQLQDNIKRTLNTGQEFRSVVSYTSELGLRWVDTQLCKLRGKSGVEREVLWTASDITESRRNLQEAIKNYESLEQILQLSPVLFFEKSHSGHYRQVNTAFADFVGMAPNQILGRSDVEIFDGKLMRHLAKLEKRMLQNPEESTLYSETLLLEEAPKQLAWQGYAIKFKHGKGIDALVGFGILQAVVEHAQKNQTNQQALSTSSNSASAQNHDSVNPGTPADLEAARTSKLETEMEENSRYEGSGILHHDFKAMLNSVTNYTEMALNQKFAKRQQTLLEKLEELDATTQRAKELLSSKLRNNHTTASTPDNTAEKPDNETASHAKIAQAANDSIAFYEIVNQALSRETQQLPANLRFTYELKDCNSHAFARREDLELIINMIVSGARANANKTPDSEIKFSHLTLSLSEAKGKCIACGEAVTGEHLELAVHTNEAALSQKDLTILAENARQSMQYVHRNDDGASDQGETAIRKQLNGMKKRQNPNIISLTHEQGGHVFIEYKNSTLSLKLLFRKDMQKNQPTA